MAEKNDDTYMTIDEAAAYVKLAVRTLYNRRSEIPRCNENGRKVVYAKADLDEWMRGRQKARNR